MKISFALYCIGIVAWASSLPLAAIPPSQPPSRQPTGGDPCANLQDPQALWECWGSGQGNPWGPAATGCVAKSACPPRDQLGKPVLNCTYESSWRTGFRCLLFCNYGGASPWGSDGGKHCD